MLAKFAGRFDELQLSCHVPYTSSDVAGVSISSSIRYVYFMSQSFSLPNLFL